MTNKLLVSIQEQLERMRRNREVAARKKKEREEAERRRKEQEEEEEQLMREQEEEDGSLLHRVSAQCRLGNEQPSDDRKSDVTSALAESTPSAAEWGPPGGEEEKEGPVLDLDEMMLEMNNSEEDES